MSLRIAATVLVASVVVGLGVAAAPSSHTFRDVAPRHASVVRWALDRFDDAALPVPPIDFAGHRDRRPCHGYAGYHELQDGRSTVHLCDYVGRAFAEILLLHEIAHAWDHAHLSESRRSRFLALRGLTRWWGGADPEQWSQHGAEHAAEIIAWGLRDRPTRIFRIPNDSDTELLAGFVALTGRLPTTAR